VSRSIGEQIKGKESLVRHLPGSWDVVFPPGYKKHGQGRAAKQRSDRAVLYQRCVPLPETIGAHIDNGARDALIRRLSVFRMPTESIVLLTGADRSRVESLVANTRVADDD
jgi:hypothetical protein